METKCPPPQKLILKTVIKLKIWLSPFFNFNIFGRLGIFIFFFFLSAKVLTVFYAQYNLFQEKNFTSHKGNFHILKKTFFKIVFNIFFPIQKNLTHRQLKMSLYLMWRRIYYPRKLWYIKKAVRYCVATGTSLSNSTATATVRSADRAQLRLIPGVGLGPISGPGVRPPGLLCVGADAVSAAPSWAIRQLGEFASLPPGKEEKEVLKRKVKGRLHWRLPNAQNGCSLWTAEGFLSTYSFLNWPSRQFARTCFLSH